MQILIGYLVALAVLLGGGYAGLQWLAAPEEPGAALADGSHAASATSRALQAKKLRETRALHRKVAESLADDGVKPAAVPGQPDVAVAGGEDASTKLADRSEAPGAANPSTDAAPPQIPNATAVSNNPKLDARAEVRPAAKKIKAVQSEADARQRPADKTESAAARKSPDTRDPSASEPTADRAEATTKKKPAVSRTAAVSKKKRAERFASSSRKPVMMVLRTIEFADGHREQRLLPMSEARSESGGYGNVSAFTDDDDF
jgi:hypothetical protein